MRPPRADHRHTPAILRATMGLLALAGCSATPASRLPGMAFGVNSSIEWWGGTLDESRWTLRQFEAERLEPVGGIVRMAFRRAEIEKAQGQLDFSWHDRSVDLFRSKGVNVLGVLIGSAPWTVATPVSDFSQLGFYPPDDAAEFGRYAAEAASHFKGRVAFWEIWNEPNAFFFWSPQPDAARYASLLREAARAIRDSDPSAQVLSAAMAPTVAVPPVSYSDDEFLDAVLSADPGLPRELDGIAIHIYGDYPPQDPPEEQGAKYRGQMRRMRKVLERHEVDDLPLWVTEFGFCTFYRLDRDTQAAYLVRGAALLAAEGADILIPWVLLDHAPGFRTFATLGTFECERYFGMFEKTDPATTPTAVEKPSYPAWLDFASALRGARFESEASSIFGDPVVTALRFSRGAEQLLVAYKPEGETEIEVPLRLGKRRLKEAMTPGGDRRTPPDSPGEWRIKLGSMPVVLSYQ